MIVVIMGVTASGKTTLGNALATRLGWPFYDADDFHSPANIARMAAGIALTDADREPWLNSLHGLLLDMEREQRSAVLACSALKDGYRQRLSSGLRDLRWVYLRADPALIRQRLSARKGHFMPPSLIESQFAVLEEPHGALIVDAARPLDESVAFLLATLK